MLGSRTMPNLTRRGLLSASAALVASPQLVSTAAAQTATQPAPALPTQDEHAVVIRPSQRRIFVESEFAPLKTVVVAQSEMRLPDADTGSEAQLNDELSIMPEEQRRVILQLLGKDHAIVMPERQRRWEAERDALKTSPALSRARSGAAHRPFGANKARDRLMRPRSARGRCRICSELYANDAEGCGHRSQELTCRMWQERSTRTSEAVTGGTYR